MKKVVYFNQWFSSITEVIADLKQKYGNKIEFIASSKNKNHAYKTVVDRFIVEDWVEIPGDEKKSMENYFNFISNICTTYGVDIFFVKKYAEFLSTKRFELSMLGVFSVIEPNETLSKFDSKVDVYNTLSNVEDVKGYIPEYFKIGSTGYMTTDDAIRFFNKYKAGEIDKKWCLKRDKDEGGASFRSINNKPFTYRSLDRFRVNECSTSEVIDLLVDDKENAKKLIFMELLDSPEISIDCYNSKKGFVALCRSKGKDRVQKIFFNKELYDVCYKIWETYKFQFPFNVQFRVEKGKNVDDENALKLLEINPRMSGGTYYGVLFDMNIAELVLCDLLNCNELYDINKFIEFNDKLVTHVEHAVKVDE